MNEVFRVLVGGSTFWVVVTEQLEIRAFVPRTEEARRKLLEKYGGQSSAILALPEFLKIAAQHPVLQEVTSWDPFWEELAGIGRKEE